MSMKLTPGKLQCFALAFSLAIGLASANQLSAQSASRQGSGTTNPDPFQLPAVGQDDKFNLPGVPPLPNQDPAAQPILQSFQDITVNEKYAGWRQASNGANGARLDETIRSHWVMSDETGKLPGIVYGVEGADIGNLTIYLLFNGRVVTSVLPKDDGTFIFANVRQGVYSLVGWGDNAFFAFGVNVLRFNPEVNENVSTDLKITATQNETTINTDWIQFFADQVEFPVYGRYETGEGETDPARLYGVAGQQLYLPPSRPATSISSHQVIPAADGRLIGRIHQMSTRNGRPVEIRNTRVILLKGDDVYAAVTTDSYGVFEFPEVPAGEYACVAVGKDGIGCIGFYLGEPATNDEEYAPLSLTMTPSETTGWLNNLAQETAYLRIVTRPRFDLAEDENYGGYFGPQGCHGPNALRPGGYRPPPRSAIPKDQRFFRKANRFIDNLFFQDSQGAGSFGNGYIGNGAGTYNGNGGFGAAANFSNVPAPGPIVGGSTSRNNVPTPNRK